MELDRTVFCERFSGFVGHMDPEGVDGLLATLGMTRLAAGETLLRYGQQSDSLYLIVDGSLSIELDVDDATMHLAVASAGHGIGEISLIEPGPASATVTAVEDCTLLTLTSEGFKRFGQDHPKAAAALLKVLSENIAGRMRASAGASISYDEDGRLVIERPVKEEKHRLVSLLARLIGRRERAVESE